MSGFFCALPVIGAIFNVCQPLPPLAVGYVEGEYVLVAPIETAQITTLHVRRGSRVAAGQPLAEMERRDTQIAVAQANAALAQAQSQLANLLHGKRPEEIIMIEASLNSVRAQAAEAVRDLARQTDLLERGAIPQAKYDQAETNADIAAAKVAELEANLAVARLPAREDEIRAAEAAVAQARAAGENAAWRLSQRSLMASSAGTISDIIRNPGEIAGPQAPVLSLLPDGAVKLRLYLPEADLSRVAPGTDLLVFCDGCEEGLRAAISYISPDPEFTPPVIYSLETRQKLVYLVEALPFGAATALKPGQLVDVALTDEPR